MCGQHVSKSIGDLGVERLLHKKHDSAPVDQFLLGAWYSLLVYTSVKTTPILQR